MPRSPLLSRIVTVVLRVRDRLEAVEWYRDHFDLRHVLDDPSSGISVLELASGDSVTLWVATSEEMIAPGDMAGTVPVFESFDAHAHHRALTARGIRTSPISEAPGLRSFSFWDLDDNRLEIWQVRDE